MNDAQNSVVILVNLGTPDTPSFRGVMRFLLKFLSDRRVVELPSVLWRGLLYLILPLRSYKTVALYKKIWLKEGSPLKVWTERLAKRVQKYVSLKHGNAPKIVYAMTYSNPHLEDIIKDNLKEKKDKLIILPLFPYYSSTTTAAVFDTVSHSFKTARVLPSLYFIREYGGERLFNELIAKSITDFWQREGVAQQLLFSFHGIPQRNILRGDPYIHACKATVREVREILKKPENTIGFSFQSRFGFGDWAMPYTETLLLQWAGMGIKTVDVICPSFAVDCLETLEEIAIKMKEKFINAGGLQLRYIPALNDDPRHAEMLADIILKFF